MPVCYTSRSFKNARQQGAWRLMGLISLECYRPDLQRQESSVVTSRLVMGVWASTGSVSSPQIPNMVKISEWRSCLGYLL